jgi:SAM-dependent methyltransferase
MTSPSTLAARSDGNDVYRAPIVLEAAQRRRLLARYWTDWARFIAMCGLKAAVNTVRGRGPTARRSERGNRINYEAAWSGPNAQWIAARNRDRSFFRHRGGTVYASFWYMDYYQLRHVEEWLHRTGAKSCLEIGCGRGQNLVFLALRNPGLADAGCDLSYTGVHGARAWHVDLRRELCAFSEIADDNDAALRGRLRHLQVAQATAPALPFRDKAFDFTFTRLAFEQMNYCAVDALREMRRVTRDVCVLVEPFLEASRHAGRFHLRVGDYFRRRLPEIEALGFECVDFDTSIPTYLKFGIAAATLRVK